MSNQYRSPASLQDVAKDPDVPTPKKGISTHTALIAAALVAVSMTGLIALIFTRARATAVQEAAPAQTVSAAAVQWQAPGPGETVKRAEATTPPQTVRAR